MMRLILRAGALLALGLLLIPAGFANSPAKSKHKKHSNNTNDTTALSSSSDPKTSDDDTATAEAPKADATAASPAQGAAAGAKKSSTDEEAPDYTPMLSTTGTIGLFTVETADTLPKGGFGVSADANKFGAMPGSATIFQLGVGASYGVTDWFTLYGNVQAYQHSHVGDGCQLSLNPCNNGNGLFPNQLIYHTVGTTGVPGYIENYPFVSGDDGGVGPVTIGFKIGLLSERRGAPVSFSFRNDFIIPTTTSLSGLLNNGTQTGQLDDLFSLALSKQWGNTVTVTFNAGHLITRDPRQNGEHLFTSADQNIFGAGFILFPESRIQPMSEYTATLFTGSRTPDFTDGARDPIAGVWGVRLYLLKNVAVDVGYRNMLNLGNAHDRNGFILKVGTAYWPEKPAPPSGPPTASCSIDKSMVFLDSGDTAAVTASASDPAGNPLTYNWSATGGRIDGSGPQVRWLSAGVPVGNYTVSVRVDNGHGGSASCSAAISVEARPHHPPTISCTANPTSVFAGERSHITCIGNSPDGDALTYTWRANAGQIAGNGPQGDWDSTGLSPGNYTVTTRVDDGHGGAADASVTINVKPTPVPPQASKINECAFGRPLSARIDNVCKRILDDVALRLQNEPRATVVIIGYSDPKERRPDKVAGDRGANAVKYLGEKGIDASRTMTRTGSGQAGANNNRRIDIIWVPEGATY